MWLLSNIEHFHFIGQIFFFLSKVVVLWIPTKNRKR